MTVLLTNPYMTGWTDPPNPTTPADPATQPSVLKMDVPNPDRSIIQMGAGTIPAGEGGGGKGISVSTGSTVHLHAGSPATHAVLGAEVGGYRLQTAGKLVETVDLTTQGVYTGATTYEHKAGRDTTVSGGLENQKYQAGHDRVVTGAQNLTVTGHKHEQIGDGVDTVVTGDYALTVSGVQMKTVAKDHIVNFLGADFKVTSGNTFEYHGGTKTAILLGVKTDVCIVDKNDVVLGLRIGLTVGPKVDLNIGPRVEVNAVAKNEINLFKQKASAIQQAVDGLVSKVEGLENKTAGLDTKTSGLESTTSGLITRTASLEQGCMMLTNQLVAAAVIT